MKTHFRRYAGRTEKLSENEISITIRIFSDMHYITTEAKFGIFGHPPDMLI